MTAMSSKVLKSSPDLSSSSSSHSLNAKGDSINESNPQNGDVEEDLSQYLDVLFSHDMGYQLATPLHSLTCPIHSCRKIFKTRRNVQQHINRYHRLSVKGFKPDKMHIDEEPLCVIIADNHINCEIDTKAKSNNTLKRDNSTEIEQQLLQQTSSPITNQFEEHAKKKRGRNASESSKTNTIKPHQKLIKLANLTGRNTIVFQSLDVHKSSKTMNSSNSSVLSTSSNSKTTLSERDTHDKTITVRNSSSLVGHNSLSTDIKQADFTTSAQVPPSTTHLVIDKPQHNDVEQTDTSFSCISNNQNLSNTTSTNCSITSAIVQTKVLDESYQHPQSLTEALKHFPVDDLTNKYHRFHQQYGSFTVEEQSIISMYMRPIDVSSQYDIHRCLAFLELLMYRITSRPSHPSDNA